MADSLTLDDLRTRYHEYPRRYFAPLANAYRKAGFLDRAILLCEKHLVDQPEHLNGLIIYGQALVENSQLDEARVPLKRALGVDPDNLIALRLLGDIAYSADDRAAARRWYGRVLELDRGNLEVRHLLAELEPRPPRSTPVNARRATDSAPLAQLAAPEGPLEPLGTSDAAQTPIIATETIAALYLAQGHRGQARAVYQQLVNQAPHDTELRVKLAELEATAASDAVDSPDTAPADARLDPVPPTIIAATDIDEAFDFGDFPTTAAVEPHTAAVDAALARVSFSGFNLSTPTTAPAVPASARSVFARLARRPSTAIPRYTPAQAISQVPAVTLIQASVHSPPSSLDIFFDADATPADLAAASALSRAVSRTLSDGSTGLASLFAPPV